tara:strand:+ start:71714 stop:72811 length:1098 start_codon:yes stop_codon:yes gene_type:complete
MPIQSKLTQYRIWCRHAAKWLAIRGGLELLSLASRFHLLPQNNYKGVIFTLHHVRPGSDFSFEPNSYLSVTPQFLEATIASLQKKGWIAAHVDDLPGLVNDPDNKNRYMAFTLDDGYRDNVDHALPVFARHNIPFTIFITSGFTDRSRTMWWITLEELLRKTDHLTLDLEGGEQSFRTRTNLEKRAAFSLISDQFDVNNEDAFVSALDKAACRAGIDPVSIVERETLDEAALRNLSAIPLVRLGAHTVSHVNLARTDPARLASEIKRSGDHIATLTGDRPKSFAYPNGGKRAAGGREFDAVAQAGYDAAVTTCPGLLAAGDGTRPTALPRISLNGLYQNTRCVEGLLTGIPFRSRGREINPALED